MPTSWSADGVTAAANADSLSQWWTRFQDPLLDELIRSAMQSNTEIERAQAALRQARALRDIAAASLLPAVGSSVSAQHGTAGGHSTGTSFKAGLDASWEVDIFGGNRNALAATEATAQAGMATLGDVAVSIAAETALGYVTLRSTQLRFTIAGDNLKSQIETAQITQWRLQAGLVSSLESEQARSAVEQTRAQLPSLQAAILQSQHSLAVLIGQPPAALLHLLVGPSAMPRAPDGLVLSFPLDTLRQRADVRVAEHNISAAAARLAQADAARLPSFKLGGSIGLTALSLGALTNGTSLVTTLLAGVSMPVFDGGASLGQVRVQLATLEQARVTYRAVVLNALREVEDALTALHGDQERVTRLALATEAAGNAAHYARQRYSSGIVDFQTVLDTQRAQLSTQDGLISARADIASDHVRLYKALGGGWQPDRQSIAAGQSTPSFLSPQNLKSSSTDE